MIVLVLLINGCSPFPDETRSLNAYIASRDSFPKALVSHFPKEKPDASADPVFSYFPGALQGGAWIQLRVKLPPNEIRELAQRLDIETDHKYQGGSFFSHYNEDQDNNLPTASYHTSREDSDAYEFPLHFTLYVLHADDRGGGWNHGETSGIAVSTETNEAIYWAESW